MEERSVAEWRKIFNLKYTVKAGSSFITDGVKRIVINKLKTEETDLIIPNKIGNFEVGRIDAYAFQGCKSLTSIVIPESVKDIECSAFLGCSNLSKVEIKNDSVRIADDAFRGCPRLADENGFVIVKGHIYGYYGGEKDVVIPDNVSGFSVTAFSFLKDLETITIPDNIDEIPLYAFSDCTSLKHVYIHGNLKKIDESAFYHCNDVTLHAPIGSVAEEYAKKYNLTFQEL